MANPIQIKRTSVSGRAANTSTLTNPGELAINMTDGIMYSTNGSVVFEVGANLSSLAISGTPAINSSGYWVGPSLYAQQEDYIYSITTSTSVITGADDNSDVLSYTAGLESVFINGVRQIAGVDYATTNATAITLTDPVINNDVVQVINFEGSIEATNVDAQFAWTNTHTFSNTVTINDKLGIGTSSPDTSLHISEPSTSTTTIRLEQTDTSLVTDQAVGVIEFEQNDAAGAGVPAKFGAFGEDANAAVGLRFYTGTGATANERMRIDSSGNVGIGTASPLGLLEVANITEAASEDTQVWFTTRGTGSGSDVILNLVCENTTTGETFINFGDSAATDAGQLRYNHDGDIMQFRTATSERMRIDSSGNVGIGTTSPSVKLDVNGSVRFVDSTSAGPDLEFGNVGGSTKINNVANARNYYGAYEHVFTNFDNSTEAMRIDTSGNVGIGTSSPSSLLTVQRTLAANDWDAVTLVNSGSWSSALGDAALVNVTDGTGTVGKFGVTYDATGRGAFVVRNLYSGGYGASGDVFYVRGDGNVGIGTNSPAYKLDVSATGTISGRVKTDGALNAFYMEDAGTTAGTLYIGSVGNDWRVVTGSNERMRIDNSGNVGIGITNPRAKLSLGSTTGVKLATFDDGSNVISGLGTDLSGSSYELSVFSGDTGGNGIITFGQYNPSSTAYTERMRITSGGNVGIGQSSPTTKLWVGSSGGGFGTATPDAISLGNTFANSAGDPAKTKLRLFQDNSPVYYGFGVSANLMETHVPSGAAMAWYTGGSERMRIDSSGNVGIGTSSPAVKLEAAGTTRITNATVANSAIFQVTADATGSNGVNLESTYYGAGGFGPLKFTTSNTERMRIDSSGILLVGTSSTFDNVSFLRVQSLGGLSTKIAGTSLTSQVSFFNDNGRVGYIGTSGTTTSYNTSSDYRLKDNIADADDTAALIDAIKVRKFDWKADGSHQRYGMVAQELVEVAPEAVSVPQDEDDMMSVDYSKLVPMLVKEIQSLRARVAQLEGNT